MSHVNHMTVGFKSMIVPIIVPLKLRVPQTFGRQYHKYKYKYKFA